MTQALVQEPDPQPIEFRQKQRIGFNTRVSFNEDRGPAHGLKEGISLFVEAEKLGYQSGWVYQRHFDHYLSSPLPFFAAAGQFTKTITLGSAVIPMRYQDPVLLAEAAATTDLLVGERLEIAVSTSDNGGFDGIFGAVETDARTEAKNRQARFLAALSGEVLHVLGQQVQSLPAGTALKVTPHSPGLRKRIRQGVGSLPSAIQAAELGLGLMCGTVQHDQAEGESFGAYQARCIAAYRHTWQAKWGTEPPPVVVAASVLVGTTHPLLEKYAAYDQERKTQGIAASRPKGALAPVKQAAGLQISPVFHGTPDQVLEAILQDEGLASADELVLFLPPAFTLDENLRLLENFTTTIAKNIGWIASV